MSTEISDVSEKVKEYGELSKIIKITQEKLKVLNKLKKELYKEVLPKLKLSNVTKCNLPYGILRVVTSKRKIAVNKSTIKDKYVHFFNTKALEPEFLNATAEEKSQILFNYIYVDNLEYREEQSVTLNYSKDFKDQMKNLKL